MTKNKSKASYTSYRGIKNKREIYRVIAKSKLIYEDILNKIQYAVRQKRYIRTFIKDINLMKI